MVTFKKKGKRTTYPVGPISALRMEEIMSEAFREQLDIHSSFLGAYSYLVDGLDAHFKCIRNYPGYVKIEAAKASEYWTLAEPRPDIDGAVRCPLGFDEIEISSRRAFQYPYVVFWTKMPALKNEGSKVDFGLEKITMYGTGTAQFQYVRVAGVNTLRAYCASTGEAHVIDLEWAKPADAETARHYYSLKVSPSIFEVYIDRILRGVFISSTFLRDTHIAGPPYSIYTTPMPLVSPLHTQIEVYGYDAEEVVFPLNPMGLVVSDGYALPPKIFRLYDAGTDTLFAGLVISAGSETSHPVPIFGYSDKTIHFRANTAGTLSIQMLMQTGNWREYDSLSVSADTLLPYIISGQGVLVRAEFTPTSYPSTIAEAEVVLS